MHTTAPQTTVDPFSRDGVREGWWLTEAELTVSTPTHTPQHKDSVHTGKMCGTRSTQVFSVIPVTHNLYYNTQYTYMSAKPSHTKPTHPEPLRDLMSHFQESSSRGQHCKSFKEHPNTTQVTGRKA